MPRRSICWKKPKIVIALVCYLAVLTACAKSSPPDISARSWTPELKRIELAAQKVRGISGLTHTSDGSLLAVGERDHMLLTLSAEDFRILSLGAITGVEPGVDLESIAWLGNSRIALGTERKDDGREYDTIYIAEVVAADAQVESRIELNHQLWGIKSRRNQGIEGLCATGMTLLAALETTVKRNGKRFAPIGRYDMNNKTWKSMWLQLTSESGKLSAIDCRERNNHLDVLAIERHFEVARMLRFSVLSTGEVGVIKPAIALDLIPHIFKNDNVEGVVWLDDHSAALILDNDYGSISGPNTLLYVSF